MGLITLGGWVSQGDPATLTLRDEGTGGTLHICGWGVRAGQTRGLGRKDRLLGCFPPIPWQKPIQALQCYRSPFYPGQPPVWLL